MKQFDHIPTAEVKQDILDTKREIFQMKKEEKGFRLIGDRLSLMRADNRHEGILQREAFIKKLEAILEYRRKSDSRS